MTLDIRLYVCMYIKCAWLLLMNSNQSYFIICGVASDCRISRRWEVVFLRRCECEGRIWLYEENTFLETRFVCYESSKTTIL